MRKTFTCVVILVALLLSFGCKTNSNEKNIEKQAKVTIKKVRYDYLPFKTVIQSLKPVAKELAILTPDKPFIVSNDRYAQSFAIGVISADAVMAISSHQEDKLKAYTETLIEYSKNIGLEDEILKMADELQMVISQEDEAKWDKLQELVLKYQNSVEKAFYAQELYDQFTLMQLGGWTEGLNKISALEIQNWNEEHASIINQKGIVNAIIDNLQGIESDKIKDSIYFKVSSECFSKIKNVIYSEKYTIEHMKKINELTNTILKSVQ